MVALFANRPNEVVSKLLQFYTMSLQFPRLICGSGTNNAHRVTTVSFRAPEVSIWPHLQLTEGVSHADPFEFVHVFRRQTGPSEA